MSRQHDGFGGPPAPADTTDWAGHDGIDIPDERRFEITCDDVDVGLLCGEKATMLIVMEGGRQDDSPWFVTAYCDDHAKDAADESEEFLSGEYVIVSLNGSASGATPAP